MNEDEDKYGLDTNTDYSTKPTADSWVMLAWLVMIICFIAVVLGFIIAGSLAYLLGI